MSSVLDAAHPSRDVTRLRAFLSVFVAALLSGWLALSGLLISRSLEIPLTSGVDVALSREDLLPLWFWLLANAAWSSLLGAALIAVLALLLRTRSMLPVAIAGVLVQFALLLPSTMGNNALLERHRPLILVGVWLFCTVDTLAFLKILTSVEKRSDQPRRQRVLLAGEVFFFCTLLFFGVSSHLALYPFVLFFAALWCQLTGTLFVRSLASTWNPGRRARVLMAGAALGLLVVAALAPAGLLDGPASAHRRNAFSWFCGPVEAIVSPRLALLAESKKVMARLGGRRAAGRYLPPDGYPSQFAPVHRHHVVLLVVDALRADHVGPGRATPAVAPNLEALAARGSLYLQAFSPSPKTGHSIPSMLTGLSPLTLSRLTTVPLFLPSVLRSHGYRTATTTLPDAGYFWVYPALSSATHQDIGFDLFLSFPNAGLLQNDVRMLSRAAGLLAEARQPVFAYLHLMALHDAAHAEDPRREYGRQLEQLDRVLGQFFQFLEARRLVESTVLVVTSDHGEALGEHGMRGHAQSLYREQVAVPLLVAAPRHQAQVIATPTPLTELPGLIMAALGGQWHPLPEGTPPALALSDRPYAVQQHLIMAEQVARSIRTADWSFIDSALLPEKQLFSVGDDALETRNLCAQMPEQCAALSRLDRAIAAQETDLAERINAHAESHARPLPSLSP